MKWLAARVGCLVGALLIASTAQARDPFDRSDPFEPANRYVYRWNAAFDAWVLLPAVKTYEAVVPSCGRRAVSNFFDNLASVTVFGNCILQAKGACGAETFSRFLVNTTIGIGGLFDPASSALALARHDEDFGQTLGAWGLGPGPYLVLPVFGPSSLRDAVGLLVDRAIFWVQPFADLNAILTYSTPAQGVDERSRIPFEYGRLGPFEYDLVRVLYLDYREALVED